MASPHQQQAFQRKLIYLGCIIVLFTGAWLWRHYAVETQANTLGVRELSRGDVNVSDKLVRLTLTGSRGLLTTVLWMTAIDEQKKNQWNRLEGTVATLTTLQPHFTTPWLFQSWNLSYNVSVELDRLTDKYFYIARGIELLAEGERQNHNSPDMRWSLGFTYQHKICLHDETNYLRSLFQLSMIPPNERDPSRFRIVGEDGRSEINLKEFEQFCKDHPQLMRRLHSGIQRDSRRDTQRQFRCAHPESVVQFLADNYKVLSLYEPTEPAPANGWVKKEDKLLPETERFPILPPAPGKAPRLNQPFDPDGLHSNSPLNDGADGYMMARAWYGYSMEPLPSPSDLPGESLPVGDRVHQRLPKGMMTSIFRQYTARGASYVAERLQQEGWFEPDTGMPWQSWPIADWFDNNKFSDDSPAELHVEYARLSQVAWEEAYKLWLRHGEANHLILTPAEESQKKQLAEEYRRRFSVAEGGLAPALRKEDLPEDEREKIWDEFMADQFMRKYQLHRNVSNFHHHYIRALVERDPETVKARSYFYQADTKRINASPHEARRLYENPAAMPAWRALLLKPGNEEFRKDMLIQEDTAEVQLKYFDLVNEDLKPRMQKATQVPWAFPLPMRINTQNFPGSLIRSPFLDEKGKPIIEATTMQQVEQRRIKPGTKPASPPVQKTTEPAK